MLRRFALVTLLLAAVPGAAHGAAFVNPTVALPGVPVTCTQLLDTQQRLPAVAGSAAGRAIVAALSPDCSVTAALRSSGIAFGAPQRVGGRLASGTETLDVPQVLVNAAGDAVVAWSTANGCNLAFAPGGSDTLGAPEPPPSPDGATCAIALDGAGRVTVTRSGGLVDRSRNGSSSAPANPFGAGARVLELAGNEAGDTVAIAETDVGGGSRRLDIAIRAAGGGWGAAAPLATVPANPRFRTVRDVSLAVDAAGRITAVWPDAIEHTLPTSLGATATLMYATGTTATGMGSPHAVPSPGKAVLEPRRGYLFTANARGDAAIVFAAVTSPLTGALLLSDLPAGGAGFGPPRVLGTLRTSRLAGAYTKFNDVAVPIAAALASDGTLEIAQAVDDSGSAFLQARIRPPGGQLGKPIWLSPPGARGLALKPTEVVASAGPSGAPLVAWRGPTTATGASQAIFTSPNAPPVAAAGGAPPVTFRVLKVAVRPGYNGARYIPSMRITITASRPTLGRVVVLGRPDVFAVRRAGVSTITDGCFTCYRRPLRPGKRLRLVIDLAGAGDAKVVRTVALPR